MAHKINIQQLIRRNIKKKIKLSKYKNVFFISERYKRNFIISEI
jgi:hypothetical protein